MSKKIIVLKPFVVSAPIKKSADQTISVSSREYWLKPGEQDVPDWVADHPYVQSGADGKIELPEVTAIRLEAEAKKAKVDADQKAALLAQANAALSREKSASNVKTVTDNGAQTDPAQKQKA